MSTSSNISREVAARVLSHFGRGGYPAGDWTESLISLIDRADMVHRAKLTAAFPDYGAAIALAKYDETGIDQLAEIATRIRCTRCQDVDGPFTQTGLCEPCARPMPLDGVA
jgi:hypothetical protein